MILCIRSSILFLLFDVKIYTRTLWGAQLHCNVCEKFFWAACIGSKKEKSINSDKSLFKKLCCLILSKLILKVGNLFPALDEHDIDHEILSEDLHSLQLVKAIIKKYLTMRLLRYGQDFTQTVIQKGKLGLRQQSNKMILFKGL